MSSELIAADEMAELQNQSENVDELQDRFHDVRGPYPLRELAITAVEGEYTHVQGYYNRETLRDSVVGLVEDFVSENMPDNTPTEVKESLQREIEKEVYDAAVELMDKTEDEQENYESTSDLQSFLRESAANISETN